MACLPGSTTSAATVTMAPPMVENSIACRLAYRQPNPARMVEWRHGRVRHGGPHPILVDVMRRGVPPPGDSDHGTPMSAGGVPILILGGRSAAAGGRPAPGVPDCASVAQRIRRRRLAPGAEGQDRGAVPHHRPGTLEAPGGQRVNGRSGASTPGGVSRRTALLAGTAAMTTPQTAGIERRRSASRLKLALS